MNINAIIASTSTLYGGNYLEYILPELSILFKSCETILFIPYARPGGINFDDYTKIVAKAFSEIGKKVVGIHQSEQPKNAILTAEAIFIGGGNTFLLVDGLYANDLIDVLKTVIKSGTPYLGTSAGSNICGISMQNTNDMPIIFPPSFDTLGILPFNINPHYLDPDLTSKHNGETRETRIKEYHQFHKTPVLGLREGSWIEVKSNKISLKGTLSARLFIQNQAPIEIEPQTELFFN